MKKLLLLLLLFYPLCGQAQIQGVPALQTGMTASTATTGSGLAAPTANFHQITWSVIGGTPTACTITVDTSPDNSSWTTGGAIAAQTCTGNGQSPLTNVVANFVRINLSTFTSTGSIRINYFGYPGGTGNIVINSGTNTGGAAMTLDMTAATSPTAHIVPVIAGANPSTTNGAIAYDSTQLAYQVGDAKLGKLNLLRGGAVQQGTTDTLTCSVIGSATETAFATTYTVKNGSLIANKALKLTLLYQVTSSAVPTFQVNERWGGTGVNGTIIYSSTANAPPSATNNGSAAQFITIGTTAAGASVASITEAIGGALAPLASRNTTAQSVNIPTNADETVFITLTCSANTAGNSMTVLGLIPEWSN